MIHSSAKIGNNVVLGEHVVIEENVEIGDDAEIGHHVIIKKDTKIGNRVQVGDLSVLGKTTSKNKKMARKPGAALTPLVIEDDVRIGCSTVLYRNLLLKQGAFVGDLTSIREKVEVGEDSIIGRNVIVETNTIIGRRVTVQTGCYVTADMIIEDEVFIGPCVSTSNDKYMGAGNYQYQGPIIKRGAKIGNNATLLPGITIYEDAIIGAGTVVTKDVAAQRTAVGNPARIIK